MINGLHTAKFTTFAVISYETRKIYLLILLLNDLRRGLSLSILLSFDHMYGPRYLIECLP